MKNFSKFFESLLSNTGYVFKKELKIEEVRFIIKKINEYLYTNPTNNEQTFILDDYYQYFSDFHYFWEKHHQEILSPSVNIQKCTQAADSLHNIYSKYGKKPFTELYDTFSLKPEEICKIRYFSANQDFRGSRGFESLFKKFQDDPSIFDKSIIADSPEDFLKNIGITSLSQNDKRVKYAKTAAQILIEKKLEPYDLFTYFNNDLFEIRNFLLAHKGSGFGNKKTDMFIRDMVLLNVWKNPKNFDKIDVASDINTVRVAMRTGILKTAIPLVSSFLDIFCYQYSLIDEMNALAWRKVWEIWQEKYPSDKIESPCLIDYLVYRIIGKEFCKETLCEFSCESENHTFKWHSSRNRTCQICYKKGKKNKVVLIKKFLPCSDPTGHLVIEKNDYVAGENSILTNLKECPFEPVCNPKNPNFIKFNPPKSISILGQTGWESARVNRGEGGGGLMS